MFQLEKGGVYRVNRAIRGVKKTGEPYALIKLVEHENQPEDIETPSKSNYQINSWFDLLPETLAEVKDGSLVRLVDFDGFAIMHESYEAFGKRRYRDVTNLLNAKFELA